jgi:hypothetical protein
MSVALCALAPVSCDSYRELRIESNVQAKVHDWGGNLVCASTPCVMRVSRETCRFLDSSSGYVILTARSRDGISLRSMPITTCDITNSMLIRFLFTAEGSLPECAVILYDGDREVNRLKCKDSRE